MFTKNELEFIKDSLNCVLRGNQELLDVKEMNKEARAMLFDATTKIMMKQRGEDTNTYKTLVEHLQEQRLAEESIEWTPDAYTYAYDHNDPIDKPMVDEQTEGVK